MSLSHKTLSVRVRTATVAALAVMVTGVGVAVAVPSTPSTGVRSAPLQTATTTVTGYNGYASSVTGTWGVGGTVRGVFTPVRSLVYGYKTYVQGVLTVTLRRANGSLVTGVTRQDVAIPVKAPGAHTTAAAAAAATTCTILHLVLGPLDLNLLGLLVHLNQVVLDITAQSGAGNLLGNLLCAVANLLNGTSPTLSQLLSLSNLLNRVIAAIT